MSDSEEKKSKKNIIIYDEINTDTIPKKQRTLMSKSSSGDGNMLLINKTNKNSEENNIEEGKDSTPSKKSIKSRSGNSDKNELISNRSSEREDNKLLKKGTKNSKFSNKKNSEDQKIEEDKGSRLETKNDAFNVKTDQALLNTEDEKYEENFETRENKTLNPLKTLKSQDEKHDSDSYSSISSTEEEVNSVNDEISQPWGKDFYLTCIAVKLNHPEDAVKYSDQMILSCDKPLNKKQIKLIILSNTMYMTKLRSQMRELVHLITQESDAKTMIHEIKNIKEGLIIKRCEKFINIINDYILNKEMENEQQAMFLKLKADYYRFLAEVTHDHQLYLNKQNALHFYREAKNLTKNLDNLNSTKLDIALNYSVFLNEIMNKRINSYFSAKEALFNALSALKNCDEGELQADEMRDSLMSIEILSENVEEWYNEEMAADNDEMERRKKEQLEKEKKEKEEKEKMEKDVDDKDEADFEEEIRNIDIGKEIEESEKNDKKLLETPKIEGMEDSKRTSKILEKAAKDKSGILKLREDEKKNI